MSFNLIREIENGHQKLHPSVLHSCLQKRFVFRGFVRYGYAKQSTHSQNIKCGAAQSGVAGLQYSWEIFSSELFVFLVQ